MGPMAGAFAVVAVALANIALAQDDLAEAEKLYISQCMVCHGRVAPPPTSDRWAPPRGLAHLAMQQTVPPTRLDVAVAMMPASRTQSTSELPAGHMPDAVHIAVAPPYGPNLRGVYGRPAGTVPGFVYSAAFLKALKGMEWSEAALDVWITNPQKWVPGVYMFYKQSDAEVRRKIILYLKANP